MPPKGTRPTTDRVREAIFSRLDHEAVLRGARVLDAFAGSGALGLEALSRGAASIVFVESAAPAARVLSGNIGDLALPGATTVVVSKVIPFLTRTDESFSLALLDPPYDLPPVELALVLSVLVHRLEPGATVVLEWSTRGAAPSWPAGLAPVLSKVYGETTVHYARTGGSVEP